MTEALAWRRYRQTKDARAREFLLRLYQPWISLTLRRLQFAAVDRGDLEAIAGMALTQAIADYNPDRNCSFRSYAISKMRWAIIDEQRKRPQTVDLVADMETFESSHLSHFSSQIIQHDFNPASHLDKKTIQASLDHLTERQRYVVINYYWQQKDMKEIGAEMGISCTRVWQIHRDSLRKMMRFPALAGFQD